MRYRNRLVAVATIIALASAAPAHAQIGTYVRPQLNPRPTVSPYLNIYRGGSGAINYYGIVRPQLETQRQLFQLQQEVQQVQPPFGIALDPQQNLATLSTGMTGHPVSFQNYSHYYGGRGGSGAVAGVAGGAGNPIGRPNPGTTIRPIIVSNTD
jgi:hypothetical protein